MNRNVALVNVISFFVNTSFMWSINLGISLTGIKYSCSKSGLLWLAADRIGLIGGDSNFKRVF